MAFAGAATAIVGGDSEVIDYSNLGITQPKACPLLYVPACQKDKNSSECVDKMREIAEKYPGCGFESFVKSGSGESGAGTSVIKKKKRFALNNRIMSRFADLTVKLIPTTASLKARE